VQALQEEKMEQEGHVEKNHEAAGQVALRSTDGVPCRHVRSDAHQPHCPLWSPIHELQSLLLEQSTFGHAVAFEGPTQVEQLRVGE
jgi:hypothetical protein